ncbi:MAG: flavodoxin-dependent (E)-4-hydroxy-3-methylbut-2-enyl-diphosphate synthase [Acholeplasmataceae bacterium]|jgi:(E)-4-hydroxy-3-methylbut-2-enyl-diphosphate synthase
MKKLTKMIKIKDLSIGGNHPVIIQSMTTTKTKEIKNTVKQILSLEKAGCELVRVAVLDMDDAKAIGSIKERINIPLVADIHFDYKLALEAINQGVDKVRINPGNINNLDHLKLIVDSCKLKNIPIRIGINSGSLPNNLKPTSENLINFMKNEVKALEDLGFTNIVLSLKTPDVLTTIETYRLASETFDYPLHLGVTEAGTLIGGSVKSSIALGVLLHEGIGDTIRVSLTENPELEIRVAKEILNNLNLRNDMPTLISCPTCGRLEYDMIPVAKEIDSFLQSVNKPIKVAVMGCVVNGPGEAKDADLGITGNNDVVLIFSKGKVIKKVHPSQALDELKKLILEF